MEPDQQLVVRNPSSYTCLNCGLVYLDYKTALTCCRDEREAERNAKSANPH